MLCLMNQQITKRKWKKVIKDQINKYIQDLINKNTSSKTKHLKTFKKQEYLDVMPFEEANKIIRYRLCMIDLKAYYVKNNKYCALCKYENEDLYRVIECKRIDQDSTNTLNPEQILENLYGEDVHKIEIAASQIERRLITRNEIIKKMKMQSTALSTNPDIEHPEIGDVDSKSK